MERRLEHRGTQGMKSIASHIFSIMYNGLRLFDVVSSMPRVFRVMANKIAKWFFFLIAVCWITGVMVTYFVYVPRGKGGIAWPEAGSGLVLIFRHIVWQYILLLLILLCAWVLGGKLCAALKIKFAGVLEETIFSLASGLVILSMAVMFLGFTHLLYRPSLWLLVILPIALWGRYVSNRLRGVSDAWKNARITGTQLVLILILVVCALLLSLNPLYPPVSLDAVNAYLSMPKGYLEAGWLELDPYIKYSMAPNNHTMLFTLAMGLGDEVTAVLTHFAVWCILLGAIAAFGARYLSPTGGLCGAIAFALVPVTTVTATWGNAENFIALYALMSFWAVWRFIRSKASGDAVMAGIILGFAIGLKIFLGMLWLWLLVLAAAYIIYEAGKFPARNYLLLAVISIAMVSPWLGRNAVYFGNPVFPYFNKYFERFGGIYQQYEQDLQSDTHAGLGEFSPDANKVNILTLPREMTFWPNWGSKPDNPAQYRFTERKELGIGPLFIALLPLLFFIRRRWDVVGGLLIISLLCILTWFYGMKVVYIRYWSFFFPFLTAVGGFAFAEALNLDSFTFRRPAGLILTSLLAALIIVYFLNGVMPKPGGGHLPLKEESRRAYMSRNILGYEFIEQLNRMEPKPRAYFLYGATSRFYCDFFVIAGFTSPYNYNRFWEHAASGAELYQWLREINITHLLVNEAQMQSSGKHLPNDSTFNENFTLATRKDNVALYAIKGLEEQQLEK